MALDTSDEHTWPETEVKGVYHEDILSCQWTAVTEMDLVKIPLHLWKVRGV